MPVPVDDAYDPEWGTAANARRVRVALQFAHVAVTEVLSNRPPKYVLDVARANLTTPIAATLTERQWRLIRFALERAGGSIRWTA